MDGRQHQERLEGRVPVTQFAVAGAVFFQSNTSDQSSDSNLPHDYSSLRLRGARLWNVATGVQIGTAIIRVPASRFMGWNAPGPESGQGGSRAKFSAARKPLRFPNALDGACKIDEALRSASMLMFAGSWRPENEHQSPS